MSKKFVLPAMQAYIYEACRLVVHGMSMIKIPYDKGVSAKAPFYAIILKERALEFRSVMLF